MMMGDDKKKMLQIIIGAGPADDEGADEKESVMEAKKAAFKDFADAVKSGDETKGVEAFVTMYDLCGYAKEEEKESEGEAKAAASEGY